MVTTRNKKIKFEMDLDSSEGEQDEELEQPIKPAAKRRRTNRSKSDGGDTAFNPSSSSSGKGKEKAAADQNHLITRRGGKGGKLRDLMNMPVDIFSEVCSYIDPHDLRRLVLTCKRLWEILMTKEARHIWKAALASVPDLPECPTDLNEPQYVCLLYSSECYTIGCTSRGTKADWYHRVRFCTTCHAANMSTPSAMRRDKDVGTAFQTNSFYAVISYFNSYVVMRLMNNYRRGYYRGTTGNRTVYVDAVKKAAREYEALPEEEAVLYLRQLKERRDYRIETGSAMLRWKLSQLASRASDIAAEKNARYESVKVKLIELGWDENDFPMANREFRDLVLKDQKLTPKIWQNIQPKLEPLLQTGRTERLEWEKKKRRNNRVFAMRDYYTQLGWEVIDVQSEITQINMFLWARFDDILTLPSVKLLIEEDTETIAEAQWIEVAPDVRSVLFKWWRDSLKLLVDTLENGTASRLNETEKGAQKAVTGEMETEEAISASIEAFRARLSYATSVFWCKRSTCRKLWWFPYFIRHGVLGHQWNNMDHVVEQMQPLQPEGQALVKRLLKDLDFDPQAAKSSDVVAEHVPKKDYLCTRCDERVAKYMTFNELSKNGTTTSQNSFKLRRRPVMLPEPSMANCQKLSTTTIGSPTTRCWFGKTTRRLRKRC